MRQGHEVLVYLSFPVHKFDSQKAIDAIFDLESLMREVIEETGVGVFDGNEFCEGSDGESVTFFMYGNDADKIYEAISPLLAYLPRLPGSYILKRYGKYGEKEEQIYLS